MKRSSSRLGLNAFIKEDSLLMQRRFQKSLKNWKFALASFQLMVNQLKVS
jgi:hypothetical protein